jgi:ferric-dicitrate binding protein FerR (iron transport regulator)
MDIRVTGTRFNVTAYNADHEEKVVLVSGAVQITSKENSEKTNLLPSQMYMSENGYNRVEQVDIKNYTSWVDGCYYCENENLGSILKRLSRYYGVEITCEQTISRVIFSGKLDLKENLSDIFEGIAFSLPVTYREDDGGYVINPAKKAAN